MPKSTSDYLRQLRQQKVFYDQLYRSAAETFELPDSAMWILYHLSIAKPAGEVSQQDLVDLTMLPKQTINSAVSGLVEEGLVELEPIPGTRNRKRILLTSEGEELALWGAWAKRRWSSSSNYVTNSTMTCSTSLNWKTLPQGRNKLFYSTSDLREIEVHRFGHRFGRTLDVWRSPSKGQKTAFKGDDSILFSQYSFFVCDAEFPGAFEASVS